MGKPKEVLLVSGRIPSYFNLIMSISKLIKGKYTFIHTNQKGRFILTKTVKYGKIYHILLGFA